MRAILGTILLAIVASALPVAGNDELVQPVIVIERITPPAGNEGPMRLLAFSPDGNALVSVSSHAQTIAFRDPQTGAEEAKLQLQPTAPISMAFRGDGKTLAVAGEDVLLIDVNRRAVVATWPTTMPAAGVAISPDGKTVALGGNTLDPIIHSGRIEIHDASSGELLRKMEGHKFAAGYLAYSTDGQLLASLAVPGMASEDPQIIAWNPNTATEIERLSRTVPRQHGISFMLPNVAANQFSGLPVHALHNGATTILEGAPPQNLAIAAGKAIVAGECGPMLLDLFSGKTLGTFLPSSGDAIVSTAISPDGKTIAVGDAGGGLTIWTVDVARAQAAGRLPRIRCELLMDRTNFLLGEPIVWNCRLTNISASPVPVYADASNPNRSAVRLRVLSYGKPRQALRSRQGEVLGTPRMLDTGASIELHFRSAGADAVTAGSGDTIKLPELASSESVYMEYAPPPEASPDGGARVFSAPFRLVRSPGVAFSHPVFSPWVKSSDGVIAARIHLDSALFGRDADVFVRGEIRNDGKQAVSISAPQEELYASLTVSGPAGEMPASQKFRSRPQVVRIEPGRSIYFSALLISGIYPEIMDPGEYAVGYRLYSRAGATDPPADLWEGSITIPPIRFARVLRLDDAPPAATQPVGEK